MISIDSKQGLHLQQTTNKKLAKRYQTQTINRNNTTLNNRLNKTSPVFTDKVFETLLPYDYNINVYKIISLLLLNSVKI